MFAQLFPQQSPALYKSHFLYSVLRQELPASPPNQGPDAVALVDSHSSTRSSPGPSVQALEKVLAGFAGLGAHAALPCSELSRAGGWVMLGICTAKLSPS